jgi:serine/threonine protein kinase
MLPLTPTKLGRYEIADEIGKGAMGVVYLARDPLIGRLVALKTFRIGYSVKDQELEQFRIRFMREAQSAGILTHPHIVTIHDVVEASDEGLAFIAMEYVRGTNLKLLLQGNQPMSLATALDIISQIGDALDYAHANRVIHRDVKPANILITTENRVKITDFGIARLESSNLTQEGQLLGTPNYMAPEQIQGKEVDHRADLFSLGVVLYEMLTRHKPFQGENLTVVSHRIVYDHFTPPRDYVQNLPPGIERVLTRALEKDPARRYQRAKEMVEDLRRVVEALAADGEALNETRSLSSTMALPPPALPLPAPATVAASPAAKPSFLSRLRGGPAVAPVPAPPPADSTASGAGTGTGTGGTSTGGSQATPVAASPSAPDLADTLATAAPAAAKRLSPGRLLVAAGIVLALSLLGWAAAWLWMSRSWPAGPQRSAAEDGARADALQWVREGKQDQDAGNWDAAVLLFRKAERLQPAGKGIRRLRENAERHAAQASSQQSDEARRASAVDFAIANATQALEARSYDAALAAAAAVLQMDPGNAEARSIVVRAQDGQARKARQRQAPAVPKAATGQEIAAVTPSPSAAQPAARASVPAPAETGTATLHIHIKAEMEGSVIVSAGRQELLRKTFEHPGFFRSRKPEPFDAEGSADVPAGNVELRVIVAPQGQKGEVKTIPSSLRGGSSHRLEIVLFKSGQTSIQLN